jgi:hypothetical protein
MEAGLAANPWYTTYGGVREMVNQELVAEIEKLSLDEQLSLMEMLVRSISRRARARSVSEDSLQRVRGMLKPDRAMPTDDELADDYTAYLIKKYT